MSGDLPTYLQDHAAGSAGGAALIRRLIKGAEGEGERRTLREIAAQIEDERSVLDELLERYGVGPSRLKNLGARAGEALSQPKLRSRSGDGRMLQYEAMIMGVTGKLQLWRALSGLAEGGEERLDRDRMNSLQELAERQRSRLENLHAQTARRALQD